MMTLAPHFVGAWQRRSIAIDGGPPSEPARVLWLQAGDAFADLRVPDDPDAAIDAFAGITTYDAPALTWHHTLDWNGNFAGYDCGIVERDDEKLIERGEFERGGCTHSYEEIWERIDPGGAGVVLTAAHAVVVRVGKHCLALRDRRRAGGDFDVRHARITGEEWSDVTVLGDGSELPRPPVWLPSQWDTGSEIVVDGAHWRVAERWG
jgi:Protein HRI1